MDAHTSRSLPGLHVRGSGLEQVIALHGWIADRTLLLPLVERIAATEARVASFDARGYGERRLELGPRSIDGIVHDALHVADLLGMEQFHLIGHSMGGLAAQRLALAWPGRVKSLALIASLPSVGTVLSAERRALLLSAVIDPAARRTLIDENSKGQMGANRVDALLEMSLQTTCSRAMGAYMQDWGRPLPPPKGIYVGSCRVVMGTFDPGANPAGFESDFKTLLPMAELRLLARSGHYPMVEDLGGLADALIGCGVSYAG